MDYVDPEPLRKIAAAMLEANRAQFQEMQATLKRFLEDNEASIKAVLHSATQALSVAELGRLPMLALAESSAQSKTLPTAEELNRFRGFRPTASIHVTKNASAIQVPLTQRINNVEAKAKRLAADNKRLRRQLAQAEAMATEALAVAQDTRMRLAVVPTQVVNG
jgi:hypothetical protein